MLAGIAVGLVVVGIGSRSAKEGVAKEGAAGNPKADSPPLELVASTPPAVELAPLLPVDQPSPVPGSGGTATSGVHVSPSAKNRAGRPTVPAPASSPAVPSPPAATVAVVAPAAAPAPVSPPPAAPAPSEPAYDPSRATVDVGSVTPSNVNGDAVRAAIRGLPLTNCYRDALRARGRRAFGSATLNLSIDDYGKVSGAILTGADWLPEMSRCVQGSASGIRLRAGAVSAGGGTAEVWLSFRAP
jgi:hypothetical protein